jgi:hypothetical protein
MHTMGWKAGDGFTSIDVGKIAACWTAQDAS